MAESGKKIAISADHAGFQLKSQVAEHLKKRGYEVIDLGTLSEERVDYPDYGYKLAEAIRDGKAPFGVAVCGSGIGISIALNRYKDVRAALVHDVTSARLSRSHNDANVLALGARLIGPDIALECVDVFLSTAFEGGRHAGRVEKLGKCGTK
ncbi:MAG: ribose 5-phosphate isomerase B [Alphaproteobacteria bacterium]|nr:MAG: ribose 5-phosphate isomerase B [Alphaproteobacteria bacterium]